jgi:hypothetical protein
LKADYFESFNEFSEEHSLLSVKEKIDVRIHCSVFSERKQMKETGKVTTPGKKKRKRGGGKSGPLSFWTLSIVWYSKKHTTFRRLDFFSCVGKRGTYSVGFI